MSVASIKNSDFKGTDKDFGLHTGAALVDDPKLIDLETVQSLESGVYKLDNFYPDDCGQTKARDIQTSQIGINFNAGHEGGKSGCLVDDSSYLKLFESTNLRNINQLNTRLTLTTPYVRGYFHVDEETKLINGDGTREHRSCNVLAGVSLLDHFYTPMVPRLKKEIQDPKHIIPEDSINTWKRGGVSTRQIMRNHDYYNRCNQNDKSCILK